MVQVGLGLPGISVAEVRQSAEAAAEYQFNSFSVYGDLGDLPPYAVLHASADILKGSDIAHVGPMGVPVGLQHPEVITRHAIALEEQLPKQSFIGLVRGAFLDAIAERPAPLSRIIETAIHLKHGFERREEELPPIYLGGFGPRLFDIAGQWPANGVKLGGSANPAMAERARNLIAHPDVEIVLGAVSVIDADRRTARAVARKEVSKYLAVVGRLDPTLSVDDQDSLQRFITHFTRGERAIAQASISDALLDKFALAGTPEDALAVLGRMKESGVSRFEFGTPHGLGTRPDSIRNIGETIVKELV